MITIFKDKKDIPDDMQYVELNDLFFVQNTVSMIDEKAKNIVENIDGAKIVGKYKIMSEFNNVLLDIDKLSAGCKTILNVLYYPDKVFCMKECGDNVLELLYGLENGNVYSDYAMIPIDMQSVIARTKDENKIISDYEELKEWWINEE